MNRLHDIFKDQLLKDERILWTAQPNSRIYFSKIDIVLVPFFLIACTPLIIYGIYCFFSGILIHILIGAILFSFGTYLTVGRFSIKWMQKRNTYYAISDSRIFILQKRKYPLFKSIPIKDVKILTKKIKSNGNGTIRFKRAEHFLSIFQNTGIEITNFVIDPYALFDIDDAEKVYQIVECLTTKQHEIKTPI